jgi:hypothetical protein
MGGPRGISPKDLLGAAEYEELSSSEDKEDLRFYIQHLDLHWRAEYDKKRRSPSGNKGTPKNPGPPRINRSKGRGR